MSILGVSEAPLAPRRRSISRRTGHLTIDLARRTDGPPLVLNEGIEGLALEDRRLFPFQSVLAELSCIDGGVVAVTNSRPHDGSGHVAAGLALSGASIGLRVALVGANIEPINGLAAEELYAGFHAAVVNHKPLDEVMVPLLTLRGLLHYLPPGPIDESFGDQAEAASDVIRELRESHDLVVVELPPVADECSFVVGDEADAYVVCSTGLGARHRAGEATEALAERTERPVIRVHLARPQPRPILVSHGRDVEEASSTACVAEKPARVVVDIETGTIDLRDEVSTDLVTVVIPCRNEEAFIDGILESVQQQTYENIEILIVDGMSTDSTLARVLDRAERDPRIRVIENPERIVSPGLNRALAAAAGRWFVRIDAHCTVPSTYVERVVAHLAAGDYAGVGGLKIGIGKSPAGRAIAAAMASPVGVGNSTYHHGKVRQHVEHVPFGAYPVDLARSVGGWDESVVTNQDFEFDHRIGATGKPILFDPEIVILWHCRQSLGDLFRQYRRYGRGKSAVVRLHPESTRPRHLVPPLFVAGLIGLAMPSVLMPVWLARLLPTARLLAATSYGSILAWGAVRARATDPEGPALSADERLTTIGAFLAMHLGQGIGFWSAIVPRRRRP